MNKKILWMSGLALAAYANANLSGYVKTVENAPVSGLSVTLKSTNGNVFTDANGYFEFSSTDLTRLAGNSIASGISVVGNTIQLNLASSTPVSIDVYDMMGNKVSSISKRVAEGSYSVSPFESNMPSGLYIVRVKAGSISKTFKLNNAGSHGVSFASVNSGMLAKALSTADSLVFSNNGTRIGSVAIWDDDAKIDDVIISHKVVSGSVPSSVNSVSVTIASTTGESKTLAANISNGSYTATFDWSIYNASNVWTVTANDASLANVSEATQNVTLDIVEAAATNLSYSASLAIDASEYSFATVDLGASQVASALGISTSELANVTYFAVNPDGTASSTASTAIDPGHWFDANGNVVSYDDGYVFAELTLSSMTAKIGQYPGKLSAGSSYTVKFGVKSGSKSVIFTVTLNMTAASSSSVASSSSTVSSSSVTYSSSSSKVTSSSSVAASSSSVATTITMASLATSDPEVYKFVNWEWTYRLSTSGIVEGSDGTYDDYRTQNSSGLSFEHIINGKGTLKYCVVWEKKEALSKSKRDQIRQMLIDITHAWTDYLTGFEGWPYSDVNVVATGWAVYDASYIQDKQSDETVYTTTKTDGMVGEYYTLNFGGNTQPYCADGTYDEIFQVVDGYTSYSTNSWGFAGGGLWVAAEHVESMLGVGIPHIVAHESGHNFGLPDYYNSWDFPDANYSSPKSGTASDGTGIIANASYSGNAVTAVMNAGSATSVTKYDYWLLRKFWYETKSKYGY